MGDAYFIIIIIILISVYIWLAFGAQSFYTPEKARAAKKKLPESEPMGCHLIYSTLAAWVDYPLLLFSVE